MFVALEAKLNESGKIAKRRQYSEDGEGLTDTAVVVVPGKSCSNRRRHYVCTVMILDEPQNLPCGRPTAIHKLPIISSALLH